MIRFKWGIGRILMEQPSIVIPIWHKGMDEAKPLYGTKLIHTAPIVLVFGEPVHYMDLIEDWKSGKTSTEETRIKITQRMYDAVDDLRKQFYLYS